MPDVTSHLTFLSRLELYETQRPFFANVSPEVGFDPEKHSNLRVEQHEIPIVDIRPNMANFKIETAGFQIVPHASSHIEYRDVNDVKDYKRETEEVLKNLFHAEHVVCWEFKLRENKPPEEESLDLNDPLQYERPAKTAHNDYTFTSGPIIIKRNLNEHDREKYLRPGYRFRMVNTWRSLTPLLEDCPLAVCDFRSLDPKDIVVSDRVRPDRSGELFHLHFNEEQKWQVAFDVKLDIDSAEISCYCRYWLDSMTPQEPLVFLTYDTKGGDHARLSPHAAFNLPKARQGSQPRRSVETRSIVISRDS